MLVPQFDALISLPIISTLCCFGCCRGALASHITVTTRSNYYPYLYGYGINQIHIISKNLHYTLNQLAHGFLFTHRTPTGAGASRLSTGGKPSYGVCQPVTAVVYAAGGKFSCLRRAVIRDGTRTGSRALPSHRHGAIGYGNGVPRPGYGGRRWWSVPVRWWSSQWEALTEQQAYGHAGNRLWHRRLRWSSQCCVLHTVVVPVIGPKFSPSGYGSLFNWREPVTVIGPVNGAGYGVMRTVVMLRAVISLHLRLPAVGSSKALEGLGTVGVWRTYTVVHLVLTVTVAPSLPAAAFHQPAPVLAALAQVDMAVCRTAAAAALLGHHTVVHLVPTVTVEPPLSAVAFLAFLPASTGAGGFGTNEYGSPPYGGGISGTGAFPAAEYGSAVGQGFGNPSNGNFGLPPMASSQFVAGPFPASQTVATMDQYGTIWADKVSPTASLSAPNSLYSPFSPFSRSLHSAASTTTAVASERKQEKEKQQRGAKVLFNEDASSNSDEPSSAWTSAGLPSPSISGASSGSIFDQSPSRISSADGIGTSSSIIDDTELASSLLASAATALEGDQMDDW
ncbi:hypothetical protein niasHT_002182 [Heterodera trifolii]|uniref:Uncharacterized protein n=1 Tax=Heterodera trifolii TaxID=157864 RepID=A0ABD2MFE5_9BILA